ncbi:MAG: TerB family tellurite resistance protein, partial [Myxococcota bacterium]
MASLLRFLGKGEPARPQDAAGEALTGIASELDELEPDRARFFAAFAYLLARIAGADLRVQDDEVAAMEQALQDIAGISAPESRLSLKIARTAMEDLGASHNYLVAREFGQSSGPEERLALLRCLYTVAAADGVITGDEAAEIFSIAEEIGLARSEVIALRSEFKDKLAEFR